jgi:hypothetical protein
MIVPDSKPPVLLLSLGAALLSTLIIRALRRRERRRAPARGAEVTSTGRTVKPPASARAKARPLALPATTQRAAPRRMTRSHETVRE